MAKNGREELDSGQQPAESDQNEDRTVDESFKQIELAAQEIRKGRRTAELVRQTDSINDENSA